jgi:aspartate beta-hydroxylase
VLALEDGDVPDDLFRMAGVRCTDRMQFRGWGNKAIVVYQQLINRFPDDPKLRNDLGVQYLLIGHNKYAKDVFEKVSMRHPENGFAAVHLGFILKTEGDFERGVEYLKHGLATKQEGTADGKFYYHLGEGLQRLGRKEESDQVYHDGVEAGVFASFWQRSLYNEEGLAAKPVWTLAETGYELGLTALKYNWKQIRKEAEAALKAELFEKEGENLQDTGRWAQFELYKQGKMTANCKYAPVTCALVERLTAAKSNTRGQVKFSVMHPGTHVHAHTGPTNCRLRAHLGLIVDEEDEKDLKLRVADKTLGWKEGEMFVFDDSFDHEVWHNGKSERVVLIVDLWHPDLSEEKRKTLSPI